MHWRPKMTFWRIDISKIDHLGQVIFSLDLEKAYIVRNENHITETDKSLAFLSTIFTNFNLNSIRYQTPWIEILIIFAYLFFQYYKIESIQRFKIPKKLDNSKKRWFLRQNGF